MVMVTVIVQDAIVATQTQLSRLDRTANLFRPSNNSRMIE